MYRIELFSDEKEYIGALSEKCRRACFEANNEDAARDLVKVALDLGAVCVIWDPYYQRENKQKIIISETVEK